MQIKRSSKSSAAGHSNPASHYSHPAAADTGNRKQHSTKIANALKKYIHDIEQTTANITASGRPGDMNRSSTGAKESSRGRGSNHKRQSFRKESPIREKTLKGHQHSHLQQPNHQGSLNYTPNHGGGIQRDFNHSLTGSNIATSHAAAAFAKTSTPAVGQYMQPQANKQRAHSSKHLGNH